ncbi:MAG: ATP-dependent helicase HrpB [bacterium]
MPALKLLPIDPLLPEIGAALRRSPNLVVQASPGSGKTTRIPPYLLRADWLQPEQEILVLVPRRLAAKMAALRVAEEMGEEVGGQVGYQFRFENVAGPKTRLKFLTEGMLLRYLVKDPDLSRAGLVILDEFHERHLHSDVALSYLRHLQRRRPELRLLVMSATLEVEGLAQFLPKANVLRLEAAPFPVTIEYLAPEGRRPLEQSVREALRRARAQGAEEIRRGDVLVFLPGMAEIRRSAEELERAYGDQLLLLPLHGELPREAQARVFAKADRPKVILATNVAETSLTIEGVSIVIDSGLHRQASYSWWSGIPALKTRPISKASATQRAGRAGRTGPGLCYRLYSKADAEARLAFETPEIRRSDLTQTLLEIKAMGVTRLSEWEWFEAPPAGALAACSELLFYLGAQESASLDAALTSRGRRLAELPIHPRLGRMLLEAEARGCLGHAAWLAALVAEDALEGIDVFPQLERPRGHEGVKRLQRHLLANFRSAPASGALAEEAMAYSILAGFPDRVAKRRGDSSSQEKRRAMHQSGESEWVFCAGGAGLLGADAGIAGNYAVVLDVQEKQRLGQSQGRVHIASMAEIREEWLLDWQGSLLEEREELIWDGKAGRAVQVSRLCYGQLVLSESRGEPADPRAARRLQVRETLGLDLGQDAERLTVPFLLEQLARRTDPEPWEEMLTRLQHLRGAYPDLGLLELSGQGLAEWLTLALEGSDFSPAGLVAALPPRTAGLLNQQLPTSLTLAKGRRVKIHYPWGREPWIESRLQDFFGMSQGPRLAEGRVPLLLHLLAPNQRAVQVTKDLAGFWKNTYPQVRQELKRRYPRHAWPEDPLVS